MKRGPNRRKTARKAAIAHGLKIYVGIPCTKGHGSRRYVSSKKCVVCSKLKGDAYRAGNPGKAAKYSRLWRAANRDRDRELKRQWVARNREQHNAAGLRYWKNNPDRAAANARKYRSRKLGAAGSHGPDDIATIAKQQKNRCGYCRKRLTKRNRHVDHIVALTKNGTNHRANIQLLCASCNHSKNNKDPIQFAQQRGLLL